MSEATLRTLYGKPAGGTYVVYSGVVIAISDKVRAGACELTISGRVGEPELMTIFDEVVPVASRGAELHDLDLFAGPSGGGYQAVKDYEKVAITYMVVGPDLIASPAAFITFKSKSCDGRRAQNNRSKGFSVTHDTQPK